MSDSEVLLRAFDVISREGFHSFTYEQVARAVGLSPAALVKRFKSKTRLARLARNQKWDENLGRINPEHIDALKGLAGLWAFLKVISLSINSKRLGEHAVWLGTEAGSPGTKKKVADYFESTRQIFARLLHEAIKSGELSRDIEPKSFAKTLEALVQGAIFQFAFLDERDIEVHLKSHIRTLLKPYVL